MLVKNRYGGVQDMPECVAQFLIQQGTVTAVEPPKPAAKPEPKPRKPAKPAKQEAE